MSHIQNAPTHHADNKPRGERWLLGHYDLRLSVRHADGVQQVCLLILMLSNSGNVLRWIGLPFQSAHHLGILRSYLDFLIRPALSMHPSPPAAICLQADPSYPPSLPLFFAGLNGEVGLNTVSTLANTVDNAKLETFFEEVEEHGAMQHYAGEARDESALPTLEELNATIGAFIEDWNQQSNRWEM